jgi:hypothetical protein
MIPRRILLGSRQVLGSTKPPMQWVTKTVSSGMKWQGRETDHLPPSNAEDKNVGDIIPPPYVFMTGL